MSPSVVHAWNAAVCDANNPCANGESCVNGSCGDQGGFGSILVMNFSDLQAPITDAYLDANGHIQGDKSFVEIRFELLEDISSDAPRWIELSALAGNDAAANSLNVEITDGLLVTSE